jgi:hypothetical protein
MTHVPRKVGTSMNVGASRSGLLAFMRKSTASPWLRFR